MWLGIVLSVMNGFEAQLKGRILGVLPQAIVSQIDGKTAKTERAPEFIAQLSSAGHPEPIVQSEAVIQSPSQLNAGLLIGIKPSEHDPIERHLIAGHLSNLQAGEYQLFIGHSLARSMDVSVGDKVRLMVTSASQFTPLGRIPSQRLFTVAGIYNTGSDVDKQLMITHISDAGKLMRLKPDTMTGWRLFFNVTFTQGIVSQNPLPVD